MNEQIIQEQKYIKYLGVYLTSSLSWKDQVTYAQKKAKRALSACGLIMGKTWGLPTVLRKRIYECVIIPMCTYGSPVWSDALKTKTLEKKLRTVEQTAASFIVRCQKSAKYEDAVWLSEITPIAQYIKEQTEAFKNKHNSAQERKRVKRQRKEKRRELREEWYKDKASERIKKYFGSAEEITTEGWRTYVSTSFILNTGLFTKFKDKNCMFCKAEGGTTPIHLVMDCAYWKDARENYLGNTKEEVEASCRKIASIEEAAEKFNNFCETLTVEINTKITERKPEMTREYHKMFKFLFD